VGVYSEVAGVPEPYDPQFKLWDEGRTYRQGDEVPAVGVATTYAVRIGGPGGRLARYVTVQEGRITNVLAHQPVHGRSVFDKWGGYLGVGGQDLTEPSRPAVEIAAVGLVDQIVRRDVPPEPADARETAGSVGDPVADPVMLSHRFWLRPHLEIEVALPADLEREEMARLQRFLETLPFG